MTEEGHTSVGAEIDANGARFRVWAPTTEAVAVVLYRGGHHETHRLARGEGGFHAALVPGVAAGARYRFRIDGHDYPDPASRSQPEGVNGPSEVVDPTAFRWTDTSWPGVTMDGLVIYELHIGTFTPEGTFDAAITRLDALASLGITAVEVMPVASFPGARNWGYDGVLLFAPSASYGGPDGFRRFVDAAHARGLAVILDVVYNHFGPEGNYLPAITGGRFFTDRHATPWGAAINYDGPDCRPVREFVIDNALHWAREYHVDGLRLDATHAIVDNSPTHILRELAGRLHALDRPRLVIAEDERNERRLVAPAGEDGFGLDAVWSDDLHHHLRRLVAGDHEGYFHAFSGSIRDVATTLRQGWFFDGRARGPHDPPRGTSAEGLPPAVFVHCIQNHDQVGNRALGDRLNHAIPLPVYRALSALLLVSPYTPLLWMGQEWAASTPFQYFTDHPEALGRLVTEGRREEFRQFKAFGDPLMRERIPDPQSESTFLASKLAWEERDAGPHHGMLALYRELLRLRRTEPALRESRREFLEVAALGDGALALRRSSAAGDDVLAVINLERSLRVSLDDVAETRPPDRHRWSVLLSTEERRFGGEPEWGRLDSTSGLLAIDAPGAVILKVQEQDADDAEITDDTDTA